MWVERHVGGCSCRGWGFDCEGEDSVMAVGDDGEVLIEGMKEPCLLCLLSSRVNRGRGGYWLSTLQSRQCTQVELCSLYWLR